MGRFAARKACGLPKFRRARVDEFTGAFYYLDPQQRAYVIETKADGNRTSKNLRLRQEHAVPKSIRLTLLGFAGLTVGTGLIALAIYLSMAGGPAFYQAAVERDPTESRRDSDECLQQAAALASNLQSPGDWQAIFTADQINGWLAVDLAQNYGQALPPEISDPRVELHSQGATLACTYHLSDHETVMSIGFDLYLSEPNVVALRLRRVRAGLLPVPLADVLKAIADAGHSFGILVQWRQVAGDPVALVHLSHDVEDERDLRLEAIELREGEVFVAGRTLSGSAGELARRERHLDPVEDRAEDEMAADNAERGDDSVADESEVERDAANDPMADVQPSETAADETTRTAAQSGSAANENRQR
jgi:hypothetical protein